jgi:Sortase domain
LIPISITVKFTISGKAGQPCGFLMADEGEMEYHDMRPPESAPRPEPSWPTVIETTVRLWLERHPVVVAGKTFRIQLPVLPRDDSRSRRRAGMPSRKRLATIMLAVGVLVVGAGAGGLAMTRHRAPAQRSAVVPVPAPVGQIAAIAPAQDATIALPVALTIPAIGVQTVLVHLGLTASGALQVPSSTAVAGWYTGSSRPGAIGPAVIAGHIDSYTGPGIFFRLSQLRPGDRVYVRRADGTIALFHVTAVRSYAKDNFPTQAVYGPTPDAELRLITCGGTFDPKLRSYLSNTVVYAAQLS